MKAADGSLNRNWSFPLRISSVNMTKSAVNCGFGHVYWRNPWWKTSFFCAMVTENSQIVRHKVMLKVIIDISLQQLWASSSWYFLSFNVFYLLGIFHPNNFEHVLFDIFYLLMFLICLVLFACRFDSTFGFMFLLWRYHVFIQRKFIILIPRDHYPAVSRSNYPDVFD